MKIESFESELLDVEFFSNVELLEASHGLSFSQKALLLGLDPENDFLYSDLRYSDFSNSDLGGFNFTGCDLRHSAGLRVNIDDNTIFDDARLDGSIFASRLNAARRIKDDPALSEMLRRISGWEWNDKIRWIFDKLYNSSINRDRYIDAALAIFHSEMDAFGKKEIIKYIMPKMKNISMIKEFLLSALSGSPDNRMLVAECIKYARRNALSTDPEIIRTLMYFLKSDDIHVRQCAVKNLSAIGDFGQLETVRDSLASAPKWLSRIYVQEVARRYGGEYELITRHPQTNEPFSIDESISYEELNFIARRWLRVERPKHDDQRSKSLVDRQQKQSDFSSDEIDSRIITIKSLLEELNEAGCSFELP